MAFNLQRKSSELLHPTSGSGGDHVLMVDDEDSIRKVTERLILRLGYHITSFTSPADALSAFAASPESFGVLVTDFQMGAMRGDVLIRRIRAIQPGFPAVIISGSVGVIELPVLEAINPVRVLAKPFRLVTLAEALAGTFN